MPKYLRRVEASEYLRHEWGLSAKPRTLAKLAVIGGGPPFRKAGKFPLYTASDLDAYAQSRIGPLQSSTSDVPEAA